MISFGNAAKHGRMFQDSETETGGMYDAVQMGTMGRFFFGRITYCL
jgi:hypothetical protein